MSVRYADPQAIWGIQKGRLAEYDAPPVKCASLRTRLLRLLSSKERWGWDGGRMSGRFDRRAASRMMAGSESVFKRRWEAEGINTAVSILIDGSSSMCGKEIVMCQSLCIALADICEKAGAALEINMFVSGPTTPGEYDRDMYGDHVGERGDGIYAPAALVEFKSWDKKSNPADLRTIASVPFGGTPDAHAVYSVIKGIASRPEPRKIVMVLTDGQGGVNTVRHSVDMAEKMGIAVFAFAIGVRKNDEYAMRSFRNAYPRAVPVMSADDLDEQALGKVVTELEKTESKRRKF